MGSFTDRLRHAWNAFRDGNSSREYIDYGSSFSYMPSRRRLSPGNEKTIVNAVLNRIALDAAQLNLEHCRLDENDRYLEPINSHLNNCLNVEANIDQTGRAFLLDLYLSLLDEGCVAVVPVETTLNPKVGSFDVIEMRVAKIIQWYPQHVRVRIYNDKNGQQEELTLPKKMVSIIENPFYTVMNESSSTLKRLIRKLNILDAVDDQLGSGKLDLIIQLPYVIRTESREKQAEKRRKSIEQQLAGSKYGIAYTDGTEHITQLNRPVENNLMKQIEYLTSMLYSQLGITEEIMNGTADETVMNNYYSRTIEPIVSAAVDEMKRKFLSKTARTQRQSILFFRDPFKLMPTSSVAEIADKFTRNEIMTSNEIRQIVGMKPSSDPKADELRNKNLNQQAQDVAGMPMDPATQEAQMEEQEYQQEASGLDTIDQLLQQLRGELGG